MEDRSQSCLFEDGCEWQMTSLPVIRWPHLPIQAPWWARSNFSFSQSCWWLSVLHILSPLSLSTALWSQFNTDLVREVKSLAWACQPASARISPGCLSPESEILAAAIPPHQTHIPSLPTASIKGTIDKVKRTFNHSFVHTSLHTCVSVSATRARKAKRKPFHSCVHPGLCGSGTLLAYGNRKTPAQP